MERRERLAMYQPLEDHAKRRLVEHQDIAMAISILSEEGFDVEDMLAEMTKLFYVDLDAFREVVEAGWHHRRH
jgi:hypothetical protein